MLDLNIYSKYRTEIMGIATIMIIMAHARGLEFLSLPICEKIQGQMGNCGVELFLFVSGFGLYYSLSKAKSLSHWYKHRYLRIGVPFVLVTTSLYFFRLPLGEPFGVVDFSFHITTLEYWLYHNGAWYVAMLIPLYFLSPFIYRYFEVGHRIPKMFVLITISLVLARLPIECTIYQNACMPFESLPLFFLGMGIAPWVKNGRRFSFSDVLLLSLGCLVVLRFGLKISAAFTIPILAIIGYALPWISKVAKWLMGLFVLMGEMSLESYLTNIYLGDMARNVKTFTISGGGILRLQ